jgi:hypothetical protein
MSKKIPHGLNIFDLAKAADLAESVWDNETPENAMLVAFEYLLGKSGIWAPVIGDDIEMMSSSGWTVVKLIATHGHSFFVRRDGSIQECFRHEIRPRQQ